ncbi:chorismate--pyruvate lyase family protein [Ignatzschineria sp. LJL83]
MKLENLSIPNWYSLEQLFAMIGEPNTLIFQNISHLLEIDSLTVGLEQMDPNFSVNLISLEDTIDYTICDSEKNIAYCRKVELQLSGKAVVYAESICDLTSDIWKEYLHCGTNSLGRSLFSSTNPLKRSSFKYALFSENHLPVHLAKEYSEKQIAIIARRSYFIKNHQKLWITEWFLPSLIKNSM